MAGCCSHEFAAIAVRLDDVEPQGFERCDDLATEMAIVSATRAGVQVYVHVPVCIAHDLLLSKSPGYERSIRLRSRPDSATTSPAADS